MTASQHNQNSALADRGQEALWSTQEVHYMTTSESGPVVSIAQRAEYLGRLMTMLNKDGQAYGLSRAVDQQPYQSQLERRYGGATYDVVNGAVAKAGERKIAEKHLFAIASGMTPLENSGIMEPTAVKEMTAEMYDDFLSKFGVGNALAADRAKAMRQINKSATRITGTKFPRKR